MTQLSSKTKETCGKIIEGNTIRWVASCVFQSSAFLGNNSWTVSSSEIMFNIPLPERSRMDFSISFWFALILINSQQWSIPFISHILKGRPEFFQCCNMVYFLVPERTAGDFFWQQGLQWTNLGIQELLCKIHDTFEKMRLRDDRVFMLFHYFLLLTKWQRIKCIFCNIDFAYDHKTQFYFRSPPVQKLFPYMQLVLMFCRWRSFQLNL